MRRTRKLLFVTTLILVVGGITVPDDESAPYVVFRERDLERLEERLKDLGKDGYRVIGSADGSAGFVRSSTIRLHLERTEDGRPIDYRVVNGPFSGKLESVLNDEASEGYRIIRDGVLRRVEPNVLGPRDNETAVLILERDLGVPANEYKLLSPGKPKQFQRELSKHHRSGFRFTGTRGFSGGWLLVVLERPITEREIEEQPPEEEPYYLALDHRDRQKLFDSVGAAAKRGYRVVGSVHRGFVGGGNVVLMERAAAPGRPYSYFFLGSPSRDDLEERLNEGGAVGYRFIHGLDPLIELIMERAPGAGEPLSYRTVLSGSEAGAVDEVAAAIREGFALAGIYADTVVMERSGAAGGARLPEAHSLSGDALFAPALPAPLRADRERLLAEAQARLEQAPGDVDAWIWVGRRTAYLGRYREAIAVYARALEQHPDDPRLYRHRGHRYVTTRRLDLAVEDLERAARLIAGTPDEIELDGLPNARNQPTSTLHSNVWYHLGLAYYLQGDYEQALRCYRECLQVSTNPDMLCATSHWLYMTLRRLDRQEDAVVVLEPIHDSMDIIENEAYHRLLLMYKGERSAEELERRAFGDAEGDSVNLATAGYGIGNWYLYNGDPDRAVQVFRRIVEAGQWPAFGHIAAEADLDRLSSDDEAVKSTGER